VVGSDDSAVSDLFADDEEVARLLRSLGLDAPSFD
jgi:hypothetical protein